MDEATDRRQPFVEEHTTTTQPWATAPVPLRIEVSFPLPGTGRLFVAGEVDLATAPMLGTRLLTVIDTHHPAVVDVDLGEVTFLDCSGIGMLAAVRSAAEHVGCQIRISHPQPIVARVLDLVGLLGLFTAPVVLAEPQTRPVPLMATRSRVVRMAKAMVGRLAA